jgi:hypothetical protein
MTKHIASAVITPGVFTVWTPDAVGGSLATPNMNLSPRVAFVCAGIFGLSTALAFTARFASAATASGQAGPLVLRTLSVTSTGSDAVVTLAADRPLPAPTVGTLDGPPRIFLDFAGVTPRIPPTTRSSDRRILRVRAALHSVKPVITRVVIDLAAPQPHRIEQTPRNLLVVIGSWPASEPVPASSVTPPENHGGIAPVPPLPPPAPATEPAPEAPPVAKPSTSSRTMGRYKPAGPAPPARDLDRYKAQVGAVVDRLWLQYPLLQSLDAMEHLPAEQLQMANEELDRIRQELTAVAPPETVKTQHDLLLQAARLGGTAVRLRWDAIQATDTAMVRNAASAAAGAILMLDRACAEVGCQGAPGRRP